MSPVDTIYAVSPEVVAEHVEALQKALDAPDQLAREYWGGVALGYLIGMGVANRDALVTVRSAGFQAAPFHMVDAPHLNLPRRLVARRSFAAGVGIMQGYAESTAHHPDADSCTACGNRIVPDWDEHTFCTEHGYLCGPFSGDCTQQTCTRRCWADT